VTHEHVAGGGERSPLSRTLLTVVGTLVVALAVYAVVVVVSVLMGGERTLTSKLDVTSGTQVVLDADTADVNITAADVDEVTLVATVTDGLLDSSYQVLAGPDGFVVDSGCMTWLAPGCGVALELRVPVGTPVSVTSTDGDLTAHDLQASGAVLLTSTSGDIEADGLVVDELAAHSTSGDVDLEFSEEPYAIKATTDDGDVDVELPDGERTYQVVAESPDGDVSTSLTTDRAGEGLINLTSDSGDIHLEQR